MENKTKGMTTCKICGRDFPLIIEDHYTAKEASPTGLAALSGVPRKLFDAFDCPHCGCQNVMQQRYPLSDIMGSDYPIDQDVPCSCNDCHGCDKCQEEYCPGYDKCQEEKHE